MGSASSVNRTINRLLDAQYVLDKYIELSDLTVTQNYNVELSFLILLNSIRLIVIECCSDGLVSREQNPEYLTHEGTIKTHAPLGSWPPRTPSESCPRSETMSGFGVAASKSTMLAVLVICFDGSINAMLLSFLTLRRGLGLGLAIDGSFYPLIVIVK